MVVHYQPGAMLQWTSTSTHAFTKCKDANNNCPTLAFLDINAPITLETDASDYGIGAYLFQTLDDKQVPIAFLSKALSAIQQRWDTPEKESYAIFFAIRKFAYLLNGVKFTLRTDHKNLTYL